MFNFCIIYIVLESRQVGGGGCLKLWASNANVKFCIYKKIQTMNKNINMILNEQKTLLEPKKNSYIHKKTF